MPVASDQRGMAIVPRLSIMMFLQYAVWGAWLPVASRYLKASLDEGGLGFSAAQIGMILGLAGSIGAVSAPFIAGQLADRRFRTERFLAFLLLAGGAVKWITAQQTTYSAWLWLSIAYSVVYMPTLALSNSLAFSHLGDERRQFPRVRVFGTIGWIAAGWAFSVLYLPVDLTWLPPFVSERAGEGSPGLLVGSLEFSALISVVYAAYCLTLPATPPKRDAAESLAFAKAFRLLRHPSFLVIVVASLPISVIHQVYFLQAGPFLSAQGVADGQIAPAMSVGQVSEILVMAWLGWMLSRLGFRRVLFLGGLAYVARYGVWSITALPASAMVASQFLHGICYACFFATAFIYVDRIAPSDVRHSAQTVFGILILGGGPVLGGFLSGFLEELYTPEGGTVDFGPFWLTLAGIALVTSIAIFAFFRDETGDTDRGKEELPLRLRGILLLAVFLFACQTGARSDDPRKGEPVAPDEVPASQEPNTLSDAERRAGFELLFDGVSPAKWRAFRGERFPARGWTVRDGVLVHERGGGGGDLVTREVFEDFELRCEWKVEPGGNSGIFYRVSEDEDATWKTGPEMQVLDDARHPDGKSPLTSAGALYGLYPAPRDVVLPAGRWNRARIVVDDGRVEHWLNGVRVVACELGSDELAARIRRSKFAEHPGFARQPQGRIALQDHGDEVRYRSLRIRRLP